MLRVSAAGLAHEFQPRFGIACRGIIFAHYVFYGVSEFNLVYLKEGKNTISLLIWIFWGFLAGLLAKMILPGSVGGGFILTTILGIVGAVVGGYIGSMLGYGMVSSFDNIGNSLPAP